jgi:hypothetical protein
MRRTFAYAEAFAGKKPPNVFGWGDLRLDLGQRAVVLPETMMLRAARGVRPGAR